jgi:hypothetical protein
LDRVVIPVNRSPRKDPSVAKGYRAILYEFPRGPIKPGNSVVSARARTYYVSRTGATAVFRPKKLSYGTPSLYKKLSYLTPYRAFDNIRRQCAGTASSIIEQADLSIWDLIKVD